ncbi:MULTISPECIES: hypothetical protein [Streptomyces]|uniref:Uncharacterized protein n=1 Tax=Streptomyces nigrescens TaxID=1920 RepID=A0ABY7JEU5_STRNI|nr:MULTISPECIES: hypothetical protein [Streptomyces]MCX5448294.1 hypothetical protein [Streptomyces libani]WAU09928.1 hypothetical protein STRNI_001044 [Streptomyces nigrescens]WDT60294.1 hypothetical protein NUT86_36310 [Streptomyces sp. G7(2002)]
MGHHLRLYPLHASPDLGALLLDDLVRYFLRDFLRDFLHGALLPCESTSAVMETAP